MSDFAAFFLNQATASVHVKFVYDVAAGQVVFVNAAYQQVLHGTVAGVNAELPALLARLHPDDRSYLGQFWERWCGGDVASEVELRLQSPGQPDQWFCLTPSCQAAAQGPLLLGGTLRDISGLKHYKQNADLFNSRKNVTLEILSHDLSGAFIMVEQIAQFLHEEMPVPPEGRVAEMLHVLETTSQNSVKMIRDLINLEFLTSTNSDLKRDRADVGAVLRVPLDQFQHSNGLLGHHFAYTLPSGPVYAHLDINKFTQVIINLISNAVKFTPDTGRITVQVEALADTVRIRVSDDGIGIPLALQPALFERFTPARRPGLRGEATTGLGLALCQTIVEWHQGTLTVVSAEGQGSTFTIEIPRAEAEAAK